MKKLFLIVAVATMSVSFGASRAAAQGPQGAGAGSAASSSSIGGHSLNPIKWVKKEPKSASDALDVCVAALLASNSVGLDFNCLKSNLTGVQTSADMSSCKGPAGDKSISLSKAIHVMKPDADAKAETKNAEKQAKDDLKAAGA